MYICNDCKRKFKEPNATIGSGDYWYRCPWCSSENYRKLEYSELIVADKTLEQRIGDIEKIVGEYNGH